MRSLATNDSPLVTRSQFHLDVDARGKGQLRQRLQRASVGVQHVDEALMSADFKLLARILVDMRSTDDRELLNLGRQRNGPGDVSARAACRLHDLHRGLI